MVNSNVFSLFVISKSLWNIFQDKYYPGAFTKTLIDPDDHAGPVPEVYLNKGPNVKIECKFVLRYFAALGS